MVGKIINFKRVLCRELNKVNFRTTDRKELEMIMRPAKIPTPAVKSEY